MGSYSSDKLWSALIKQESGGKQFSSNGTPLTSKAGAIGIAQVMPKTAPEAANLAGMQFDENRYRNDAEYNAALGRAYLDKQLSRFGGDGRKALAAYNAGPGRTSSAISKYGDKWLDNMPSETISYVNKILGDNMDNYTALDQSVSSSIKYPKFIQDAIDKGNYDYSKSPLKREQLLVDADFYNPQRDANWLQAPDQGPAPSMAQRFQAALPSNPMQAVQAPQIPQVPQQGRQPQSNGEPQFQFTRNRLGLATLLDELEQNEAQAERRQAKASLVNNPAFVGPSGEQMEGIVQGRREKLADYLTQAAGAKAKGLNYLGDLGTGAENRQLQANQQAAAVQQALAGNIRESDSDASRLKQVLLQSLLRQQQAPRADLRSLQMMNAAGKITDDQYNAIVAKELERLGVE